MKKFQTCVLLVFAFCPKAQAEVARPVQFVALAFDNCTENTRWSELANFTKVMKGSAKPVNFTFFVSGINFIPNANRNTYQGPHQSAGTSRIGFGGTSAEVKERIHHMHNLAEMGGEIAGHAVGHFDGSNWSVDDWLFELRSFQRILTTSFDNEGLGGARYLRKLVGFRAPYLAKNEAMYTALSRLNYRYDTSDDAEANAWPKKKASLWVHPLANLKIVGSGKRTLSMDYNFYASQSGAKDNPAMEAIFEKQMLDTYIEYFRTNYSGNRAPLNIGHHFFGYQGGAYNRALKNFAAKVCGLPEVRCGSYTELTDFMDSLSPATLNAYQRGDFVRRPAPPSI